MPNTLAYLVFFAWPLAAILMFAALPPARALAASVIVGYLLLPERVGLDLPLVPAIDKEFMINVSALAVTTLALRRQRQLDRLPPETPPTGPVRWLFVALVLSLLVTPLVTVLTNGDPVIAGPRFIPGLRLYDYVSIMMGMAISILPFVLAVRVLGTAEAQAEFLRVLVVAGSAYALLALFEVRMSPQLSNWIYGFFPHSFLQHIRGGSFRPVVFLQHGLWLGIFLCMTVLAACALWRQALRNRVERAPWLAALLWLAATLVLSRNLGATSLMLLFAPLILFAPLRWQVLIAASVAFCVLLFPMLRGTGIVPTAAITSVAQSVSADRAASLRFRLENEDALLARANQKPLAGWGSWGRDRIYDPVTGRDLSVTDGMWIIAIGNFGWLGYISQFGMLALPALILARRRDAEIAPVTAGLALMTSAAMIDLIPNATLTPVTWIAAGALAGLAMRAARPGVVAPTGTGARAATSWVAAGTGGPLRKVREAQPAAAPPGPVVRHQRKTRI